MSSPSIFGGVEYGGAGSFAGWNVLLAGNKFLKRLRESGGVGGSRSEVGERLEFSDVEELLGVLGEEAGEGVKEEVDGDRELRPRGETACL